jgi:hypothetical protein
VNRTFMEVISKLNSVNNRKGVNFLNYIASKYFCRNSIYMTMREVVSYLEEGDGDDLLHIINDIE